jgi:hypothetical protein
MSYRSRHRARGRGRALRKLWLTLAALGAFAGLCLTIAGLLYCLTLWRRLPPAGRGNFWEASLRYEPAPDYRAARAIYPYSVVPGGVASREEVEDSMAQDTAVAEHYRGIHLGRLEPVRLSATIRVYASYRNAGGIHWTRQAVRVLKGELVLSDGVNLIRGRCGNRLAFLPPEPLPHAPALSAPPDEPPAIALEYGTPPIFEQPPVLPAYSPESTATARYWPPPPPPVVWCCTYATVPIGAIDPHSTTGILEPASLLLLGSGGVLIVVWSVASSGRKRPSG